MHLKHIFQTQRANLLMKSNEGEMGSAFKFRLLCLIWEPDRESSNITTIALRGACR